MICKVCWGKGWILNGIYERIECPACHGTKETDPTNEDWFCSLSTEGKAEWLSKHFHCGDCIFEKPMCGGEYDGCKSAFEKWLKQPHGGEP